MNVALPEAHAAQPAPAVTSTSQLPPASLRSAPPAPAPASVPGPSKPSVGAVIADFAAACRFVTRPANGPDDTLQRAEDTFNALRHQWLLDASLSPRTDIRQALVADGFLFGAGVGAAAGFSVARTILQATYAIPSVPVRLATFLIWAGKTSFQWLRHMIGTCVGTLPHTAGNRVATPAAPTAPVAAAAGASPSRLHQLLAYRPVANTIDSAQQALEAGVSGLLAGGLGLSFATLAFVVRLTVLSTVWSAPSLQAGVAAAGALTRATGWVRARLPGPTDAGAQWPARWLEAIGRCSAHTQHSLMQTQSLFASMHHGLGHALEFERFHYEQWRDASAQMHMLVSETQRIDPSHRVADGADVPLLTYEEFRPLEDKLARMWRRHKQRMYRSAWDYRYLCIRTYHFDPARAASFCDRPGRVLASHRAAVSPRARPALLADWEIGIYTGGITDSALAPRKPQPDDPAYVCDRINFSRQLNQHKWACKLLSLPLTTSISNQMRLTENRNKAVGMYVQMIGRARADPTDEKKLSDNINAIYEIGTAFRLGTQGHERHFYHFVEDFMT